MSGLTSRLSRATSGATGRIGSAFLAGPQRVQDPAPEQRIEAAPAGGGQGGGVLSRLRKSLLSAAGQRQQGVGSAFKKLLGQ